MTVFLNFKQLQISIQAPPMISKIQFQPISFGFKFDQFQQLQPFTSSFISINSRKLQLQSFQSFDFNQSTIRQFQLQLQSFLDKAKSSTHIIGCPITCQRHINIILTRAHNIQCTLSGISLTAAVKTTSLWAPILRNIG